MRAPQPGMAGAGPPPSVRAFKAVKKRGMCPRKKLSLLISFLGQLSKMCLATKVFLFLEARWRESPRQKEASLLQMKWREHNCVEHNIYGDGYYIIYIYGIWETTEYLEVCR